MIKPTIVTFMSYPRLPNPQQLLEDYGGKTICPEKGRYFTVRDVEYRDGIPVYSIPSMSEKLYEDVECLVKVFPSLKDSTILQNDNYLMVWIPERDK